jgi:hypothetical protein
VLHGGLCLVFLKRIRNQPTSVTEAFSGFGPNFAQLLLAGFLSTFLAILGYFCFVLPWVYLKIAWIFCLPLVIDKRLEFWTAMELSRQVVTRVWFKVFALAVIAFAPTLLFTGYVYYTTGTMMHDGMEKILSKGALDLQNMGPFVQQFFAMAMDVARATAKITVISKVILLVNLPFGTGALMYAYEALFGTRPAPAA